MRSGFCELLPVTLRGETAHCGRGGRYYDSRRCLSTAGQFTLEGWHGALTPTGKMSSQRLVSYVARLLTSEVRSVVLRKTGVGPWCVDEQGARDPRAICGDERAVGAGSPLKSTESKTRPFSRGRREGLLRLCV